MIADGLSDAVPLHAPYSHRFANAKPHLERAIQAVAVASSMESRLLLR